MKRGPRPREYYQVILYIGIAKLRWPQHEVVGLISYRDKTVWIYHDQRAFQGLVDLKPEAVRSIRAKKAANPTPLPSRLPCQLAWRFAQAGSKQPRGNRDGKFTGTVARTPGRPYAIAPGLHRSH